VPEPVERYATLDLSATRYSLEDIAANIAKLKAGGMRVTGWHVENVGERRIVRIEWDGDTDLVWTPTDEPDNSTEIAK
jgi:hypothetical protein